MKKNLALHQLLSARNASNETTQHEQPSDAEEQSHLRESASATQSGQGTQGEQAKTDAVNIARNSTEEPRMHGAHSMP